MIKRCIERAARTGAFGLSACLLLAAAQAPAQSETIEFNASIWFPDAHPLTKFGYLDWAQDVETASGGTLKPKVFTGTVLLPPAAHLSGVTDGIAQVAYHAGTFTPKDLPRDNVLAQLGFVYSDYFVATFAITDMNMTDPEMLDQWRKHGVVYGGGYATVPYRLFCTTKVVTLADIKGKKLRMPGAAHSDWAKSVGAVPVNVPSSEMYNGLEKGQLDCASNGANELKTRSLWEVSKQATMVELGVYWAGYQYGFNNEFWQSLSPEQRRTLLDTIAAAIVRTGIGYQAAADETVREAPSHGVTLHEPAADLTQSIQDFARAARANAISLGKEEFGLADPAALISRFEQRIEKWERLLAGIDRKDEAALTALLKAELYDKVDVGSYGLN